MFNCVFSRRLLLAMLAIVAACSLSIYMFSVPLVKKTVYTIEKDSAQTILENVFQLLHLRFGGPDPQLSEEENARRAESRERLAMTVSDHLASALANLKLRDRLQELSVRDPLTRLFNRRYMEETLARELRRAERARSSLDLIMLDVDHFKLFNDSHGHEVGDRVLKAIGGF